MSRKWFISGLNPAAVLIKAMLKHMLCSLEEESGRSPEFHETNTTYFTGRLQESEQNFTP
jgi:hypothetical protein